MAWLAKLDTRAARWPLPVRWSFLIVKWTLVAAGAFSMLALAVQEVRESRVGLGTGVVTMMALALIKGLVMAWQGPAADGPPAP